MKIKKFFIYIEISKCIRLWMICSIRMNKYKSSKDDSSIGDDKTKPNKKLTSMWRYFIGDQAFSNKTGNSKTNMDTSESVIGGYQFKFKQNEESIICSYWSNKIIEFLIFQIFYPPLTSYRLSTCCTILKPYTKEWLDVNVCVHRAKGSYNNINTHHNDS